MLGQRNRILNLSCKSIRARGMRFPPPQQPDVWRYPILFARTRFSVCQVAWISPGTGLPTGPLTRPATASCTLNFFCGSIGGMRSPTLAHLGTWRYLILIPRAQRQAQFAPCPLERPAGQPSLPGNPKITQTSNL